MTVDKSKKPIKWLPGSSALAGLAPRSRVVKKPITPAGAQGPQPRPRKRRR